MRVAALVDEDARLVGVLGVLVGIPARDRDGRDRPERGRSDDGAGNEVRGMHRARVSELRANS